MLYNLVILHLFQLSLIVYLTSMNLYNLLDFLKIHFSLVNIKMQKISIVE